ncbi:hypothetical protein CYMTET_33577 [Cymbomonas tetramitiformis]|uniref:peptidylprolyl isomerase n=1 Tax=Cymbomonas tetramitiformis TaxID=36881 RepID=A0AAE0FCU7_9CHLO|nr:hypothetical protein CYMTET_33577 [Cymbomonas tetramitiformis]
MSQFLTLKTTHGDIKIRFRDDVAPSTCKAMRQLVSSKMYDGCCFYRAEPGFVIQGGLRLPDGSIRDSPVGKLPLEYKIPNTRGTVTMARWGEPDSATSEWFINLNTNTNLDRYTVRIAPMRGLLAVLGEVVSPEPKCTAGELTTRTAQTKPVNGGLDAEAIRIERTLWTDKDCSQRYLR